MTQVKVRDYINKQAQAANTKVYYGHVKDKGLLIVKAVDRKLFLLTKVASATDKTGMWWMVSPEGIAEFKSGQKAINAFFDIYKTVSASKIVRRDSFNKISSAVLKKSVPGMKTASVNDDDPWIKDPEQLISKSSRELWGLTNDGKYLARLFEESDFPLNV